MKQCSEQILSDLEINPETNPLTQVTATAFLLYKAHERLSNIEAPHLLVHIIPTNNARYCCEERAWCTTATNVDFPMAYNAAS